MANIASPVPYITRRELGLLPDIKSQFFNKRLNAAKNLYRRDLVCHYGCVNAIEFSSNGELLVSGGDDRRVMLWKFGQAVLDTGKPEAMKAVHQSNIFCLGITTDNQKIYSGGNDDSVIVHDLESRRPLEVLQHQKAVCGLSINPENDMILSTAGNDGRLLLFDCRQSVQECLVISRSRRPFHAVMFHPIQVDMLVSANARDGVALWDVRAIKRPVIRYSGNTGASQNSMSVRFNDSGNMVLALRRRLAPIIYNVHSEEPVAEFYHPDYYNSCTMKSCCFAGEGDKFVVSGSDDFNLYMWKVPNGERTIDTVVEPAHIVMYGHRSIVNQVRYNPHFCLIASSGVEKIIKLWSVLDYPNMQGCLLEEAHGPDNPREMYSHEEYVSLVHHSGQYISHNYAEQSTNEDPRMMAFFDSLVQRELGCLAETDSMDGSTTCRSMHGSNTETSDSDQVSEFLPIPKRYNSSRSQRHNTNRFARLLASRYTKNIRSQNRGSLRRNNKSRASGGKCMSGPSAKGKRAPGRSSRAPRRPPAPRTMHTIVSIATRVSAPSDDHTDSDETTRCVYRNTARIIRPLRRRMNLSRAAKRKPKSHAYRKPHLRSSGMVRDIIDSNYSNFDNFEDNLAVPSTSTGYRGQSSSSLFRIAEVDSDDDQSTGSRPISPRNQNGNQNIPNNLISIIPTPINGSRDSLGDSLRVEPPESETNNSPPRIETRLRSNLRRLRRNGRQSFHRSDSSESPPPKDANGRSITPVHLKGRLFGYKTSVAQLMNETNESELESSCSAESVLWPTPGPARTSAPACTPPGPTCTLPGPTCTPPGPACTPDSGISTAVGSSTRAPRAPAGDVSDDPEYLALKFRQRVKKARRNYRNHIDSDSN